MSFFSRLSLVLAQNHQNVSNTDHDAGLCIVNDTKPQTIGREVREFVTLRKGQKITLPSGKQLTVKEFDGNWIWCDDNNLPVFRGVVG